jgi:lipopolysaccharide export system permease protein
MRILDAYIARAVAGGVLLVMCVLLSLFVFVDFISEMDKIGQGQYNAWEALKYVMFSVPRLAYELMPLGALLGALLGLGLLASNNELIVMRACGVSVARISWAAVKVGLVLVVFAVWLGEWVVADAEDYAADVRASALAGANAHNTSNGFWTRDGSSIINVRAVTEDGVLAGVQLFELDDKADLRSVATARTASYQGGHWLLKDVTRSELGPQSVKTEHLAELPWPSGLRPALLDVIAVKPGSLSISGLYRYIAYLRDNGLNTARYEIEFWTKVMVPIATCVMVLASLPFVFGSLRSVGIGSRTLVGVMVGMGFYLLNQTVSYLGLAYGLNAVVCGVLPTLILLAASVYLMRRLA